MLDKAWFKGESANLLYKKVSNGELLGSKEREELMKLSLPLCGKLTDKYAKRFCSKLCIVVVGGKESGLSNLADISHPLAGGNAEVIFVESLDCLNSEYQVETLKISKEPSQTFVSFKNYLDSALKQGFLILKPEKGVSSCDLLKMLSAIRLSLPSGVFVGVSNLDLSEKMFHLSTSYGANFLGTHMLDDLLEEDLLMEAKWSFLSEVTALSLSDKV